MSEFQCRKCGRLRAELLGGLCPSCTIAEEHSPAELYKTMPTQTLQMLEKALTLDAYHNLEDSALQRFVSSRLAILRAELTRRSVH